MQTELQIVIQDMPHSNALDARIRAKVAKLKKMFPRLTSCRVTAAAPHHHEQRRRLFTLRVNIMFPGGEVVVTRGEHEDVYVLLRDAFIAVRRELEKSIGRREGDTEPHHGLMPEQLVPIWGADNE